MTTSIKLDRLMLDNEGINSWRAQLNQQVAVMRNLQSTLAEGRTPKIRK